MLRKSSVKLSKTIRRRLKPTSHKVTVFCSSALEHTHTIHEIAVFDISGLLEEDEEEDTHEDVAVVEAECQMSAVGRPYERTHEGGRVF